MVEDPEKTTWITRVVGAGALAAALAFAGKVYNSFRAPKEKADMHAAGLLTDARKRITELEAYVDAVRKESDERVKRHIERGHELAGKVHLLSLQNLQMKGALLRAGFDYDEVNDRLVKLSP